VFKVIWVHKLVVVITDQMVIKQLQVVEVTKVHKDQRLQIEDLLVIKVQEKQVVQVDL
jgi:hypothetical protein